MKTLFAVYTSEKAKDIIHSFFNSSGNCCWTFKNGANQESVAKIEAHLRTTKCPIVVTTSEEIVGVRV